MKQHNFPDKNELLNELDDLDLDRPGLSEFEEEMDKINADIDKFLEQAKNDNEAFLKELDLNNSLKFDLPDIDKIL